MLQAEHAYISALTHTLSINSHNSMLTPIIFRQPML